MQQKISVTGSSTIPADLEVEDDVVLVVVGQCSNEGIALQQTAGRVPYRKIKINDVMILRGNEADEMRDRVAAENNEADLHVINGNGDASAGTG